MSGVELIVVALVAAFLGGYFVGWAFGDHTAYRRGFDLAARLMAGPRRATVKLSQRDYDAIAGQRDETDSAAV